MGSPTTFRGGLPAPGDGSILSQGSYLSAEAEIGELEHSLTTDLLNHLVFVQKVFMKEVSSSENSRLRELTLAERGSQ